MGPEFSYDGLAYQPHGGFVVVSTGSDSSDAGVVARVFDASGNGGASIVVNTYTPGRQWEPSVTVDEDGDFVVVWGGYTPSDLDEGVFAQRFDADGARIGTEFLVNTVTEGAQFVAHVDNTPAGGFVVVWDTGSYQAPVHQIYGRRFDSSAAAEGSEFAIAESAVGDPRGVRIVVAADGRSLATWWRSEGAVSDYDVFARMYDSAGAAAGTEFRVNSYTPATQWVPSAIALANGSFVVTWTGFGAKDQDGAGISARTIDPSGVPAGTEFQVNSYTTGAQYFSSIATVGNDSFVVAWTGSGPGGDGTDIVARVFNANAAPLSDDFLVNTPGTPVATTTTTTVPGSRDVRGTAWHGDRRSDIANVNVVNSTTTSSGWFPGTTFVSTTLPGGGELLASVAGHESGRFVVTWNELSEGGIFAQRFTLNPRCSDADDDDAFDATDALHTLRAAVGAVSCAPCICDVSGGGGVTARDALIVLQQAVGLQPELHCSACGG